MASSSRRSETVEGGGVGLRQLSQKAPLTAATANGKAKARPYAQMVEADGGDAPATEADAVVDAPPTESTLADGVEKAVRATPSPTVGAEGGTAAAAAPPPPVDFTAYPPHLRPVTDAANSAA